MAENYSGNFVMRDWIEAPMTMRRGFIGAKPETVCHWAFEVVGATRDDDLIDLYPGSGAGMGKLASSTGFGSMTEEECLKDCHDSYYAAVGQLRAELIAKAARRLIAAHPVFRSKPIGAPGSNKRLEQDEAIAAEDELLRLTS